MGFYFYRLKPKEILANSKQLQSTELGTDNVILTRKFGVGGAALRLKNTKLTPNSRMEALLALSSFLHPQSNRLLTECLGDNTDEIRLLAFSKLETQERTINNKISNFEKKLVHVDNDKQRALILKNIALLYMELIYQGLSPDFLVEKKLLKALQYLKQAKIIDPEDGTIDSYIGLVYFKMQNYEIAEEFFLNAMGKNVFELKYLPYLAEIYFIKRDFNKVHAILAKLKQYEHIPNIGPIIRFWRKNA